MRKIDQEQETVIMDPPETEEEINFVKAYGFDPNEVDSFRYFQKWVEIENKAILQEFVKKASDGREVNLSMFPHILKKSLAGLPEDEIKKFQLLKKLYNINRGKSNSYKGLALGNHKANKKFRRGRTSSDMVLESRHVELVDLFGRFFSVHEVLQICVEQWSILATVESLKRFVLRNSDKIEETKQKYKRDYSDIRLGYKRSRLEEYQWLYKQVKQQYKDTKTMNPVRAMIKILESIKHEVEGDLDIRVSGSIEAKIEMTINHHVRNELLKQQNLTSLVLSRVAAKTKANPVLLLDKLNNSFYAAHMSLNGKPISEEPVELPSNQEYDFEKIKRDQTAIAEADKQIIEDAIVEEEEVAKKAKEVGLKDKLSKILDKKQQELSVVKNMLKEEEIKSDTNINEAEFQEFHKKNLKVRRKKSNSKYYKKNKDKK